MLARRTASTRRPRGLRRQALRQALDDGSACALRGEPDRVLDRSAGGITVRDHDETAQAEKVGAAVGIGIETGTQAPRCGADEQAAELAARRRGDLRAQARERGGDPALERLQGDIAGEAVADDDVGRAGEEVAPLDVAGEADV